MAKSYIEGKAKTQKSVPNNIKKKGKISKKFVLIHSHVHQKPLASVRRSLSKLTKEHTEEEDRSTIKFFDNS
jgi:hypothetical protein